MNQSDHLPLLISIYIDVPRGMLDNPTVINSLSTVRAQHSIGPFRYYGLC